MNVLDLEKPPFMTDDELAMFEDMVGKFVDAQAGPERMQRWREAGLVDREAWQAAADAGLLGLGIGTEFGGAGCDFRYEAVMMEQLGLRGVEGWDIALHTSIVTPYFTSFATDEQKRRWLPGMCDGSRLTAIAMSEPGTGSDVQAIRTTARRDGDAIVLNGSKTFITCGQTANLVLVAARLDGIPGSHGIALIAVETDGCLGFKRGKNLHKIGREAADTSELFFNDVRVPAANLLGGEEGRGFSQMMAKLPQERLVIAIQSIASIEYILAMTLEYVKQRHVFGKPVIAYQNTEFQLAECKTEAKIAKVFVNHCIEKNLAGTLDGVTASMAKYWVTELLSKVADRCLQLFGGYGYMSEYPIAQAFKDARVNRIYGGTNEIMKVLIARSL